MTAYQFCHINGQKFAYRKSGQGPPVILLHGITSYSFLWESLAAYLEDDYTVYRPDLLGCGRSAMPLDRSYALQAQADYLAEFIDQLQLERPLLVGHDLGGGIAQILAVRYPQRLSRLVLMNPVGYDYWPVQPIRIMRTPVVRQFLMALTDRRVMGLVVQRGLYRKERLTPELLELFYQPFTHTAGRKAFLHLARCLDNRDLTDIADKLPSLTAPTLILWGLADPYLSAEIANRLHRDIPGSRLETFADASHFLMLDAPRWVAEQIHFFAQENNATAECG